MNERMNERIIMFIDLVSRVTGGVVDGGDPSGAARPHPHHPARHHVAAGEVRVTWFVHFS